MPRKKFIPSDKNPYFITCRCINKEWFRIPTDKVWEIFGDYLFFCTHAFGLQVHAFILMSNHFHMLATTPQANLDKIMNYLLREVSRAISFSSNRENQTFGGPYHRSLIEKLPHYFHAYKYLYRNPVDAGICSRVEEYPFSTLRGLLGLRHLIIPTFDSMDLIEDTGNVLDWLNSAPSEIEWRQSISKALKKHRFELPVDRNNGKLVQLSLANSPTVKNPFDFTRP